MRGVPPRFASQPWLAAAAIATLATGLVLTHAGGPDSGAVPASPPAPRSETVLATSSETVLAPVPLAASEATSDLIADESLLPRWADLPDIAVSAPAPALGPSRLRELPFRTQRDGSRFAGSNCGPAALAMVLEAWGISQGNDDLRYLTHTYQGTWGRRGGTALQHMAQVAEDLGIRTSGLYEGDQFRRWSVADVRAEVERGRPVIALVKYRLLPGREYSTVRYDHYIVLWDVTPDGFIYNDPIYPEAGEGFARYMSDAQLDAAMRPTLEPRQAVAFAGPAV